MNKAADYTVFQVVRNPELVNSLHCLYPRIDWIALAIQLSSGPFSQQKCGPKQIVGMTEKKKSIRLRILSFVLILWEFILFFFSQPLHSVIHL